MSKKWEILGAPFDLGSSHRGCGQAPAVIRETGLTRRIQYLRDLGIDVTDKGDVEVPELEESDLIPRGLTEMKAYAPSLMGCIDDVLQNDSVPLVLGGDHSVSIPTVTAASDFINRSLGSKAKMGLIWIDAHPDLEIPGEDSTNDLHAMSAAHLLDIGIPELRTLKGFAPKIEPENLIFIGLRDVVPEERQIINDLGIIAYTMSDIERFGIVKVCEDTFEHMKMNTAAFALSFDIDVVDPLYAPGVDYPEPGGLNIREAMIIMEFVARSENLKLFELFEFNPLKDIKKVTSRLIVNLIHRALCGPII